MKRLVLSLVTGMAGIASLLAGLAVDAWLHARDETLAQREGIFTLTNPGHALLALGIALACGGIFSALHAAWGLAGAKGFAARPLVRHGALVLAGVASAGAIVFALAASTAGHEHAHAGTEAHSHGGTVSTADALEDGHTHDEADEDYAHGDDEAAATHGMATAETSGHSHGTAELTAEEEACFDVMTEDVRAATTRFEDFDVAVQEGYVAQAGGVHYMNVAYMEDGVMLDYEHPEVLIYVEGEDGEQQFDGVMFRAPRGESGPQPCGAATSWHTHTHCIDAETGRQVGEIDAACPPGSEPREEQSEMMHVFLGSEGAGARPNATRR